MTIINFTFTNASNYTYDSDKIVISGGLAKLKDLTPADSTFYASYTTNEDANWSDGSSDGTLTNATVSGGYLDCTGGSVKYVSYPITGNADHGNKGCIRFTMQPAYTGLPANTQYMLYVGGTSDKNEIILTHHTGGRIKLLMKDNTGSVIIDEGLDTFSPTSGNDYEIELNWDLTSGATRVFVDGVQSNTTITTTGTRDSTDLTAIRFGGTSGINSNAKYDDLIIFSKPQHTTDYTPGASITQTRYDTSNPYITPNSTFKATQICSFTSTETTPGSDLITATLNAGGQHRYVTGGSAANSDGSYSQSSTFSELNTDVNNLITSRKTCSIRIFLHSDDGSTTPEIESLTTTYNMALDDPSTSTLTEVEGFFYDHNGPLQNKTIKIRPYGNGFWNQGVFHAYCWQDLGTTDSDGYLFANVYVQNTGNYWEFKICNQRYKVALQDTSEQDLSNLPSSGTWEVIT